MTKSDARRITRNGLRVDVAKARDWRRHGALTYDANRRQRRNQARLTTKVTPTPRRSRNEWPPKVRRLAKARSGGVCEFGGCPERATDLHHRKPRRCRDHRISNALHLCRFHHNLIHANPPLSLVNGWIVGPDRDPAKTPALLDGPVLLDEHGDYQAAA